MNGRANSVPAGKLLIVHAPFAMVMSDVFASRLQLDRIYFN
jgi:hypothetical protein